MSFVRRHLGRGVTAWLLCHALTFTALVPRDCCAAHAHATDGPAATHDHAAMAGPAGEADAAPCHEAAAPVAATPAPGDHCDMPASDGAACPMHRSGAMPADCAMTGVCHAPEAALAAVLWQAMPAPAAPAVATPGAVTVASRAAHVSLTSLAVPPDAPPPRL
jgi:hypothetical protein